MCAVRGAYQGASANPLRSVRLEGHMHLLALLKNGTLCRSSRHFGV